MSRTPPRCGITQMLYFGSARCSIRSDAVVGLPVLCAVPTLKDCGFVRMEGRDCCTIMISVPENLRSPKPMQAAPPIRSSRIICVLRRPPCAPISRRSIARWAYPRRLGLARHWNSLCQNLILLTARALQNRKSRRLLFLHSRICPAIRNRSISRTGSPRISLLHYRGRPGCSSSRAIRLLHLQGYQR